MDTYLATAHGIVWDCLMVWVLLELGLQSCSAWPLLIVASGSSWVAVRQGSARSPHTMGLSFIILVGLCSAWFSSIWLSFSAGHCSAWPPSRLFFTVTAGVVSSLLPPGSMWHCSAWLALLLTVLFHRYCRGSVQSAPPRQYVALFSLAGSAAHCPLSQGLPG